jgi:hypothetical protein
VSVSETLVIDDVPVPPIIEGMPEETGDAREPTQLVIAPQSPNGRRALRTNPDRQAPILTCDPGPVESTVLPRPPLLPRDERVGGTGCVDLWRLGIWADGNRPI